MRALIFDTETTDLVRSRALPLDKQPHVVEYFGLELCSSETLDPEGKVIGRDWHEDGHYQTFINPGIPMPAKAAEITGYNDAFLADKPRISKQIVLPIKQQIERCDIYVAHNLSYDHQMLGFTFARVEEEVSWQGQKICTVEKTMHLRGFRLNLTKLHELLFDEAFEGAHGAEADVRALARCFVELNKRGVL